MKFHQAETIIKAITEESYSPNGGEDMPCDYSKYHPHWKQIRIAVLKREDNRCKLCNAENGKPHWKTKSKVVLTIAHLDHDIKNNKEYNLAALCQRCHNIIDIPVRVKNRSTVSKGGE